jgi:hypothetical protein
LATAYEYPAGAGSAVTRQVHADADDAAAAAGAAGTVTTVTANAMAINILMAHDSYRL